MTRRLMLLLATSLAMVSLGTTTAHALEPSPPNKCFRMNAHGELPTCTWDGRSWQISYDNGVGVGLDPSPGIPAGFAAIFVIVLIGGIAMTIWRVSLARQVARRSGMNENEATAVTLLTDNGLEAAYLAGQMRSGASYDTEAVPDRSTATRLRELEALRSQGLVTEQEYDARRKAILDSL
jgi:hypothetical protein